MSTPLQAAILIAIAQEGAVAQVEQQGFTAAQIAIAVRRMLDDGVLIRKDSKFRIAPGITLPVKSRNKWRDLEILSEYRIDRIDENAEYEIGHQSFAQIRDRVRP
ncbi:hypothetical protein HFC70_26085 [Agrobacterium sp. a22-2]|uniref:hypothetical protein n=1 Tax=Agrobacterium sp. a22-2 TaxID=2283840 RepID=UPI0014450757|nr:hypothetical protein [Agrobacterium sp. a22-2]NKN39825.1 hypothetical protein [Agrobacterium sp. a22-2]